MIAIDFAHSFHYRVACRITTCTRHCVQARLSYTRVCICMYIKGRWYLCPCVGLDAKPEDWKEKTHFVQLGLRRSSHVIVVLLRFNKGSNLATFNFCRTSIHPDNVFYRSSSNVTRSS